MSAHKPKDPAMITQLLHGWSKGDKQAEQQLLPLIYAQLKNIAQRLFSAEQQGHTLQPTALINEAFLKLIDGQMQWQDRAHFYALASRMMRRLLVDHARAIKAEKRGGSIKAESLDDNIHASQMQNIQLSVLELLTLNEAIEQLSALDSQKAELIELQYFAGLSIDEMAHITGRSSSSVERELRFSRAWLKTCLSEDQH